MTDLRGLELRHLVAATTVARTGTFGRAADQLGYTQSAISQQVSALENALGQQLFDRPGGPRPVVPTAAGRLLARHTGAVIDSLGVMLAELDQVRDGERGKVRLGSFQSVSVHLAPPLLARLRDELPLVEVELFETDDEIELEHMLLSGELDATFLVMQEEGDPSGMHLTELLRDPYLAITPQGEHRGPVAVEELADRPLIGNPAGVCERMVDKSLRAMGTTTTYGYRTADNGTVHAMVSSGLGVAVMPRLSIDPAQHGIEVHELSPELPPRRLAIARRSGEPGSLTTAVVQAAVRVANGIDPTRS